MKYIFLILSFLISVNTAFAQQCVDLFGKSYTTYQLNEVVRKLPQNWLLPKPRTAKLNEYIKSLPEATKRELLDVGYWNNKRTKEARLPVIVAKLHETELLSMSRPRWHKPLPSFNKNGDLFFPEHVSKYENGEALPSENFYVRMMAIKDKGSNQFHIPEQIKYLAPFIQRVIELEKQRDPENFKNRYAYIQVDASWVKAAQIQPRPGKTTTQNADPRNRQGAHVDGFLKEDFWSMQEDMTYSMSVGFNPKAKDLKGDHIPTEFFDTEFSISENLTHPQARDQFDQIANSNLDSIVLLPAGTINRMSSRVVHRVGVAKEDGYRTFVKIKFSDEAFHQAENTVNLNTENKKAPIYNSWKQRQIPFVQRKTLPTEGVIEDTDAIHFNSNNRSIDR